MSSPNLETWSSAAAGKQVASLDDLGNLSVAGISVAGASVATLPLTASTSGSAASLTVQPPPSILGMPGPASGGYVAWTGDFAASGAPTSPTASSYPSGSLSLTRMDCPPGVTINGYLSCIWRNNGSMANSFLGAYTTAGTLLGTGTADQSATSTGLIRVSLGGVTTTPANGILYIVFLNGTGGVIGGPEYFGAMSTITTGFNLSAPYRCSHQTGGGFSALPTGTAALNYASSFAVPWYTYGWYAID